MRDRVRTESIATELLELALDAALDGSARLGVFNTYPPEGHPDPESIEAGALASKRFSLALALQDENAAQRARPVRLARSTPIRRYARAARRDRVGALRSSWIAAGGEDGFAAMPARDDRGDRTGRPRATPSCRACSLSSADRAAFTGRRSGGRASNSDGARAARVGPASYLATDTMNPGAYWIVRVAGLEDDGALLRKRLADRRVVRGRAVHLRVDQSHRLRRALEEALARRRRARSRAVTGRARQRLIQPPSTVRTGRSRSGLRASRGRRTRPRGRPASPSGRPGCGRELLVATGSSRRRWLKSVAM